MNTNGSRWTDELLMAWADGALPADEVADLEAAIERDADLANRAAAMQQTRALVQEAYDVRSTAEPVPAALRAAVEDMVARDRLRRASAPPPESAPASDPPPASDPAPASHRAPASRPAPAADRAPAAAAGRPGWGERLRQWLGGFGMPAALAASLACGVVGFLIGQAGVPPDRPGELASVDPATVAREDRAPAPPPAPSQSQSPSPSAERSAAPSSTPGAPAPSVHDRERSAPLARESVRSRAEAPAAAPQGRSASEMAAAPMADDLSASRTARPPTAASASASASDSGSGSGSGVGSRGTGAIGGTAAATAGRFAVVGDAAPADLARLLDQLPSGGEGQLGRAPLAMVATYRDRDARVCRDFSIAIGDQSRLESVACRGNDASWQVTYAALTHDGGRGFMAAGSNAAIDAYLGSIGADQPLDPEAERAALARPGARRE